MLALKDDFSKLIPLAKSIAKTAIFCNIPIYLDTVFEIVPAEAIVGKCLNYSVYIRDMELVQKFIKTGHFNEIDLGNAFYIAAGRGCEEIMAYLANLELFDRHYTIMMIQWKTKTCEHSVLNHSYVKELLGIPSPIKN